MTRIFRRWAASMLVWLLMLTMASCSYPEHPVETTEPSSAGVTDPATDPTHDLPTSPTLPGMITSQSNIDIEQVRLPGYDESWIYRFGNRFGTHILVETEQELDDALDHIMLSLDKPVTVNGNYDADFFRNYYLVLIPVQSSSGSFRYEAEASVENGLITITVTGSLNSGVGTADMADWLLIAALPRSEYSVDAEITIHAAQGKLPDQGLDIYDK